MTLDAPAASASATSRGCRTPPSAQTCAPSRRASAAHSSTAVNCGRPTPVIIRVVHMAPGPTPTLTMSAPASTRSATPVGGHHVARDHRHRGARSPAPRAARAIIFSWWPCAVSTTSRSTPASSSSLALARDVAVDAERGGDPQPAARRRWRAGRGSRAARRCGSGCRRSGRPSSTTGASRCRPSCSSSNARSGSVPGGQREQLGGHHLAQLGEPVDAVAVGLGDHADRAAVLDHDHGAVRPLGQQAQRVARGRLRAERQRGVVDQVAALDPGRSPRRRRRPGCPAAARPGRRGGPRSRPSGARRPRSCWPRRPGSWCRCRRSWPGRRRAGTSRRTGSAPGTRRCRSGHRQKSAR